METTFRLSAGTWIALAALVLTPAGGFLTWGLAMERRLTTQESVSNSTVKVVDKVVDKIDSLARMEERIDAINDRVRTLERGHDRREASGPK